MRLTVLYLMKTAMALLAITAIIFVYTVSGVAQAPSPACTPAPAEKIALQLYSVRNVLEPPARGARGAGAAADSSQTIDSVFRQLRETRERESLRRRERCHSSGGEFPPTAQRP